MGCGSSRLEEINGVLAPARARPLFLRLEEIRIRRRSNPEAIKGLNTSSEQGLILSSDDLEKEYADDTPTCITPKGSKVGSESIEKGLDGDAKTEDGCDHEEGEDDEDDERKIGRCDTDDYPGSPSFRVYYVEDNCDDNKSEEADDDQLAEKSPIKKDDPVSLHEPQVTVNQVLVRKEKKRRNSFKKVIMLPKGRQAKNLFNVPFLHSSNHSTHLLTAKAHDCRTN